MQVYRTMHSWHWISAAICLAALLLFSITGITLNHAASIGAAPQVTTGNAQLPPGLVSELAGARGAEDAVPPAIADWIEDSVRHRRSRRDASSGPRKSCTCPRRAPAATPGCRSIAPPARRRFEATDRGWIAYFNDLHKGRNTGIAWTIFIDVAAAACVFFALTGLVLLWIQARQRTSTWPLVGGGVAILVVLMIFLAH